MISKINKFIDKKSFLIFTIFLYMQPVLDAITGIMLNYNVTFGVSSVIKTLFLAYLLYYILFIKKSSIKYIVIILLYSMMFLLTNFLFKKDGNIIFELSMLIKNIYLPVMIVYVLNLFNDNNFNIKHLCRILIIYLFLLFIPDVLNIGFNSYAYSKVGSVGFFYSANAVGSVLSFIMPILVAYLIKEKKMILLSIFSIIYLYIILTMGTKAPILCLIIVLLYYFILVLLKLIKEKKYKWLILLTLFVTLLLVLLIIILPKTAFYKNLVIHLNFLGVKSISDLFTFKNFDHFIFSSRLTFLKNSFSTFKKASLMQKLFGIGYVLANEQLKTSEMDFFVTIIHQGIVGFIIIYYLYFKCISKIIKSYFNKIKENFFDINKSSLIISIIISILSALLAGHVLETPSVSIFVVTIIGISYSMFNIKKEMNVK